MASNNKGLTAPGCVGGVESLQGAKCWDGHVDFLSAASCAAPLLKSLQDHPQADGLLGGVPAGKRSVMSAGSCARPMMESALGQARAGSCAAKASDLVDAAHASLLKGVAASMCTKPVLDAFKAVAKAEPALRAIGCVRPTPLDGAQPISNRKRQNARDLAESADMLGQLADAACTGNLPSHLQSAACWEPLVKALDAANCVAPLLGEFGRQPEAAKAALGLEATASLTAAGCVAGAARHLDDVRSAICAAAAGSRLRMEVGRFKSSMVDAVGSALCTAPLRRVADAVTCTSPALADIARRDDLRKTLKDTVPEWATDAALDSLGTLAAASPNLRKLGFH